MRGAIQQNMVPQRPMPMLPTSTSVPQSSQRVSVPRMNFTPCSSLKARIEARVDPLQHCTDFGSTLYLDTVQIVGRHLQMCTRCQ